MFHGYLTSILLIISIVLFLFCQLYAQEEEGEIIVISERVGKEIDPAEREKFKLFEGIKGFQSAVHIKLPDGRYFLKITYRDEKTGELKIKQIEQSEVLIKIRGNYIDRFEEIRARKMEEERGGEIMIVSERVGEEIDLQERDNYELFQDIKGFQSAIFYKMPSNKYILKIMYLEEQTGELKIDRIPRSKESINNYRNHIDHFEKIKARRFDKIRASQDTISQEPGAALFLELMGKPFGSLNMDFRINKSSRFSLGLVFYMLSSHYESQSIFSGWSEYEEGKDNDVIELMPNIMYYYLAGGKNNRFEIGGGFTYEGGVEGIGAGFHGVIGYRYQKKNGLLFRIGFTPFWFPGRHHYWWPWWE